MTDIQERLEREAEIMRLDLQLFMYAGYHDIPDDDYYRKYMLRNAMIWDYGKTYGTEAQERLREMLDVAREKFQARAQELMEDAGIKDTDEVGELRKQVQLYSEALRYYWDRLAEATDKADTLSYALETFTARHPEHAAEINALTLEDDDE